MARNDIILVDGIVDDRIAAQNPSADRGEVFELFSVEQFLKDFDLDAEELEEGLVDGTNDGGIDAFYVLVNDQVVSDPDTFPWPKRNAEIDVRIVSCKHHDTFRQATIDQLVASLTELLDLARAAQDLQGSYSVKVLHQRNLLHIAYRRLSPYLKALRFGFAYASRGDASQVGTSVRARADQLTQLARDFFSGCSSTFAFIGAAELIELHRRRAPRILELPFVEHLSHSSASHIVLTALTDYATFVTDEHQQLRRYLFESNVRDYMGENRVNDDIAQSLRDTEGPDFFWLNNGITILCSSATPVGKLLNLVDVQIVNGLQTTESVFRHFTRVAKDPLDKRTVLVKVVVSEDKTTIDHIIRATNNQTEVELASLHATDKIQRDIEAVLERSGWYYERRKNYYRNIGRPLSHIVSPLFLARAAVALAIKNPINALSLKSKFMRREHAYDRVFVHSVPLFAWPHIVRVTKAAERTLERRRLDPPNSEHFLARWRPLLSLLVAARLLGRFDYDVSELSRISVADLESSVVDEMWDLVVEQQTAVPGQRLWVKRSFVAKCCAVAADRYALGAHEIVASQEIFIQTRAGDRTMAADFVERVNRALPEQPWPIGVHREVSVKLGGVSAGEVSAAIRLLMDRGTRHRQKDGIVYDEDGNVIAVDTTRPS